jgi:hypothetical protein
MYLDYAERQVKLGKIISMQEWKEKLELVEEEYVCN